MPRIDKVIVTNQSALKEKYGAGTSAVTRAVQRLIAADAKRGLTTKVVALDSASDMRRFGGTPVSKATDPKQNKDAIDRVFEAIHPDYLVILGAIDVVPHQDLVNPVKDDGDPTAWGDLPYACSAPYSRRVEHFRGPTRVVGRIPDITRKSDPAYLLGLLETAATFARSPRAAYEDYLGITAAPWRRSTDLSLRDTFGNTKSIHDVPPRTARWSPALLARRAHFINCHGAPSVPHFWGQQGKRYPIAHEARYLVGKITTGTVVAAECCFGAQLFDPSTAKGQLGICNTYLAEGAYGFFGSSTTAYGPSTVTGSADIVCMTFMQRVLAGASLGRAALEARQHFVTVMSALDPSDLKTLAQFSLMGDPSIHPVLEPRSAFAESRAYRVALPDDDATSRGLRREHLARVGLVLGQMSSAARHAPKLRPRPKIRAALEAAARDAGVRQLSFTSYIVTGGGQARGARRRSPSAFHVAVGRHPDHGKPAQRVLLVIATEVDGEFVHLRRLHSR